MNTQELQKTISQLIMLSITLTFSQKLDLVETLPKLNDQQLEQVKEVLQEHHHDQTDIIKELFETNPELPVQLHEVIEKQNRAIYKNLEAHERQQDEAEDVLSQLDTIEEN